MKCVYLNFTKANGQIHLDQTTNLAVPIVGSGYGCGLIEVTGRLVNADTSRKAEPIFLCCDVCEDSNVEGNKMPALRQLKRNPNGVITNDVNHVIWLRLNRPEISAIRVYIADSTGELVTLSSFRLNCLLLFVPAP